MQFALPVLIAMLAQNPPDGLSVHELLASNDSAQLAWGAEMAARSGRDEYVPELRRLLRWSDERVQEQALDAMIRLHAKVPAEELRQLPDVLRSQVIILAVANRNQGLLASLLEKNPWHDATWVALNEGVVEAGAGSRYWSKAVRECAIHVVIYVTDPGQMAVPKPQAGGFGGVCGDSLAQERPGFPVRASYGLFIEAQRGDTVLISRPKPVYYRRASNPSGCDTRIERNDYMGEFIAFAANVYPRVKTQYRYDIAWAGDRPFADSVETLRREFLADYQRMLEGMLRRRLLQPEDSALRPHVDVVIEDQRTNRGRGLPATSSWE